jgi:formylglycine-generating enzyme required for sulfatase activity/predicted Ser/Thr protein kinase
MELPARIGKYELEEFLGGGMSHVYRARDTVIGRTVAVKILTEQGCADEEVKTRFLAEARMAGSLTHDNILGIYDFGEDDLKRPFMVMEFLRGEDLRSALRKGNTGDVAAKLKIAVQIARALDYTHSQKIVHRDIKPENIHINAAGVVKLIDFGIAKTEGLQMTRAGYVLGTPFYMAPEQVMGDAITEQVDVYAFGVLLFELFAGVKPIQAETVERIFYFILNEPLNLDPLRQIGTPQAIIDLIEQCTAKKPDARPKGFGPVVAALERAMTSTTMSPVGSKDESTLILPTMPSLAPVRPAEPVGGEPAVAAAKKTPGWVLPAVLVVALGLTTGLYFATKKKAAPPAVVPKDMVLIPKGVFLFGEKKEPVDLPAFYIDKTEVSNQAYAEFCKAKGLPVHEGEAEYPVVNVTIKDARDFAAWAGKRLPNMQEWEKAARGPSGLLYPWGNEADLTRANVGTKATVPVTDFKSGASPFGILQMVGNVWEFVDQTATPSKNAVKRFAGLLPPKEGELWYTTRGGSYAESLPTDVLFDYAPVPERWKDPSLGFRCAKDAK